MSWVTDTFAMTAASTVVFLMWDSAGWVVALVAAILIAGFFLVTERNARKNEAGDDRF